MNEFYTGQTKEWILRDRLATDRTRLANQRTLLAFVRTALYFAVSAVALLEVRTLSEIRWLAWPLMGLASVAIVVGVVNYLLVNKRMKRVPKA